MDGINLRGMDVLFAVGLDSIKYDWEGRQIVLELKGYHDPAPYIPWKGSEDATYGWGAVKAE